MGTFMSLMNVLDHIQMKCLLWQRPKKEINLFERGQTPVHHIPSMPQTPILSIVKFISRFYTFNCIFQVHFFHYFSVKHFKSDDVFYHWFHLPFKKWRWKKMHAKWLEESWTKLNVGSTKINYMESVKSVCCGFRIWLHSALFNPQDSFFSSALSCSQPASSELSFCYNH